MLGKILVFIQFFVIFLMLLPLGMPVCCLGIGAVLLLGGLLVGVAALWQNRLGNFNIRPDIKEGCALVTEGIYRYIRHPMYLSVLLMMGGVAALYYSPYELVLLGVLSVNLIAKLLYEEKLWSCDSQQYREYMEHTARLIPKIF